MLDFNSFFKNILVLQKINFEIQIPCYYFARGEMAEWSIATVLKTVDCNRSGGSNPSLSAEI